MNEKDSFMEGAIAQAKKGLQEGGIPIGSVLVRNGEIIARGHNKRVQALCLLWASTGALPLQPPALFNPDLRVPT